MMLIAWALISDQQQQADGQELFFGEVGSFRLRSFSFI